MVCSSAWVDVSINQRNARTEDFPAEHWIVRLLMLFIHLSVSGFNVSTD